MKRYLSTIPSLSLAVALTACGGDERERVDIAKTPSSPAPSVSVLSEAHAATPAKAPASQKMAPTPGTAQRDTELKDKPFVDAKTLKRLPKGTALAIVDRDGGWLKVTSGGQQGWVRLLHVSSQAPGEKGSSAKDLEAAAKLATGRAGSGNVVATTGIRGLSEEQLSSAKPNPDELKKMDAHVASKEQAAEYARSHKLAHRDVSYLPEPK